MQLIDMHGATGRARLARAGDSAVVIARPSKWGNPFKIGRDGTRDEVIDKYRQYIMSTPELMAALPELRGKVLACWCYPRRCHGEVLIELLNGVSKP